MTKAAALAKVFSVSFGRFFFFLYTLMVTLQLFAQSDDQACALFQENQTLIESDQAVRLQTKAILPAIAQDLGARQIQIQYQGQALWALSQNFKKGPARYCNQDVEQVKFCVRPSLPLFAHPQQSGFMSAKATERYRVLEKFPDGRLKVLVNDRGYWGRSSGVKFLPTSSCIDLPESTQEERKISCIRVLKQTYALANGSKDYIQIGKDEYLEVLRRRKTKTGKLYFLVSRDEKNLWLRETDVTNAPDCTPTKVEHKGFWGRSKYSFGATGVTSREFNGYDSQITSIPDASDVSDLSDPIITDFSSASGFSLGAYADVPLSEYLPWKFTESMRTRIGLVYESLTLEQQGYANPSTTPVALASLNEENVELGLNFLSFTTGFLWPVYKAWDGDVLLGTQIDFRQNLTGEHTFTYLDGNLFSVKNIERTENVSASGFETLFSLAVALEWSKYRATLQYYSDSAITLGMTYQVW